MDKRTRDSLLRRGLSTDLIDKINSHCHTVSILKSHSLKTLKLSYTEEEAEKIYTSIQRQPISSETLARVSLLSNKVCCYCADGISNRPYQIHHIEEHAISQDDSEDNLMLVCPTHHSMIPVRGYSIEEQKQQRQKWYALANLARTYEARGLSFPLKRFEALGYSTEPDIAELLTFGPPSPSTARLISEHGLGATARERLRRNNFLIIAGGSGAGKSTLAMGVAGSMAAEEAQVYRFVRSVNQDNRTALVEIISFLNTATAFCVLIIDDVNLWATNADIETIAQMSSPSAMVIATITRATANNLTSEVDARFPHNRVFISWETIQPSVSAFLKEQEPQVVAALQSKRRRSRSLALGHGILNESLSYRLRRYEKQAKSVWQFLFLLRAGWESVEADLAELISDSRADILVLHAAVEQIAGVEQAVTAEDTTEFSAAFDLSLPAPDTEWVRSVFDRLCARHMMIKVRSRYTTVHRDWARAFICSALGNSSSRESAIKILERDFDLHTKTPQRLSVLCSWLSEEGNCRQFVREWAARQNPEDWPVLIGTAVQAGLVETASVAREMLRAFDDDEHKKIIGAAFKAHEEAVIQLVTTASQEDWDNLRKLMAISQSLPEFSARMVEYWRPETAAAVFNRTLPDHYDSVNWFLGGSVWEHCRAWCREVGLHIEWAAVSANLSKVRRGDIDAIHDCLEILRRFAFPIFRSMVRRVAEVVHDTLKNAALSEIRFRNWIIEIEVFPNEMCRVAAALDAKGLASEASRTPPHQWGDLFQLSLFASRSGSTFARDFIDHIDDTKLFQVVKRYAEAYPHIFIPLLWQFAYGRPARRIELAAKFYPLALLACQHTEDERDDILRAFANLDDGLARTLAHDLSVNFPEPEPIKENDDIDLNKPLLDIAEGGIEVKEQLRVLEESGADYDVGFVIHGPYNVTLNTEVNSGGKKKSLQ